MANGRSSLRLLDGVGPNYDSNCLTGGPATTRHLSRVGAQSTHGLLRPTRLRHLQEGVNWIVSVPD